MAQSQGSMIENKFGQGLITEAHGLNFPKDAATDCSNVFFTNKLSVVRRRGLDLEDNAINNAANPNGAFAEFQWRNVSGQTNLNFSVIQAGTQVLVYNNGDTSNLSNNQVGAIDLVQFQQSNSPSMASQRCQFAQGRGDLFMVHPYMDPVRVVYSGGTFTFTSIVLQIRDFTGVNDGLAVDFRPQTLTQEIKHHYNVLNQGWFAQAPCGESKTDIGPTNGVLSYFNIKLAEQPSNADYWWAWKDPLNQFNYKLVDSKPTGNSPAPKGHYILGAFNQDRATAAGFNPDAGLPVISASYNRPSVVSFFAGRTFYAGTNYNTLGVNFASKIYFTRIIENDTHLAQCYQDGDPTAEDGSDLLPSDGGIIDIPDIGTIIKMFPMGYSLMVFATNGVWSISGSTGTGFSAKDYTVAKIGNIGIVSDTSFVDIDGSPVWWSQQGIQTLNASGQDAGATTGVGLASLTDQTIKTLYRGLPTVSKLSAKGSYSRIDNTITWCYSTNYLNPYVYDAAIVFNIVSKAFTTWTIPTYNNQVISLVLNAQSDNAQSRNKFMRVDLQNNRLTFCEFRRLDYLDYGLYDYSSYVESGYSLSGNGFAKFYLPYVFVYINGGPNNQLNMYVKWEFANVPDYSKITLPQLIYSRVGQDYQTVRKKVRGSGHAAVMRFESVSGQPFELIGWASTVAVNGSP